MCAQRSILWLSTGSLVLAACRSRSQVADAAHPYTNPLCAVAGDDSIIAAATTGFLDRSDPEPGFLVYIPATDSSPPPAAVQAMQDRRTTYMYSADPSQAATVNKKLASYGDYDALLVAYHGLSKTDPMHPVVTFSGHYVTGRASHGKVLGPLAISPVCDSAGEWHAPAPLPLAPPPATAKSGGAASHRGG